MYAYAPLSLLLLPALPALAAPPLGVRAPSPAQHASPRSPSPEPFRMPLKAHRTRQFSDNLADRQAWLKAQASNARTKYAQHLSPEARAKHAEDLKRREVEKRATGSVTLTDSGIDASYSGQVAIGTPSQDFLLIFDTGSSDMWVATTQCTSSDCLQADLFNEAKSSSFSNQNAIFDITYGSGEAYGGIGKDQVTIAGFTVNQVFGTVNQTSQGVIDNPISGILGFAWQSIAQTQAMPFWEELASTGQWSDARMGFFLQRYRGDASATDVESQGGELTMGGLDSSKYTGSVNYVTFPSSEEDYWRIPMQAVTVQGSQVSGVTNRMSAIDTGTTLISGSPSDVSAIYAQIPGSEAMSQSSGYSGYYQYPCSTTVNVTLQFGGLAYSISNADMNLGSFTRDSSMCTGAFFEMDLGQNSPVDWIVGASFLKNVYSVFQYDPPAIGFAQLSGSAQSVSNGTSVTGGSTTGGGTSGSNSTSTNGNGSGSGSTKNGSAGQGAVAGFGAIVVAVALSAFAGLV